MASIHIRPASIATDDGLRLLKNFDSQLEWLSSIGSEGQWGTSPRSQQEEARAKYRGKVERSEKGWNASWSREWIRSYVAEVDLNRLGLGTELLELADESTPGRVRVPVAGMILEGKSAEYVRKILPENDDDDPFIFLSYLLSDRRTQAFAKGAGALLINHAKEEARRLDIERITADCWGGGDRKLVQYYERQGFKVIGDLTVDEKNDWPCAVLEMRL